MARLSDIRDLTDHYIETLLSLYEKTDPVLCEDSELGKFARAQHAIEVFWYLHGKLLIWAQAHMTGYAILTENPELAMFLEGKLGEKITEDSHILEQIGLLYPFNPPDDEDPDLLQTYQWLHEFSGVTDDDLKVPEDRHEFLTATAFRKLVSELLMSRSADNSYWRFDLQSALRALNEGEVTEVVAPRPGRRQGLPYSLKAWKLEALRQVRFRVGMGFKKYRALEEVAEGIGQSVETLRDWEKAFEQEIDTSNDLYCSELSGYFRNELKAGHYTKIADFEEYGFHRGISNVAHAGHLRQRIEKTTFEEIRDKIRLYRERKSGG